MGPGVWNLLFQNNKRMTHIQFNFIKLSYFVVAARVIATISCAALATTTAPTTRAAIFVPATNCMPALRPHELLFWFSINFFFSTAFATFAASSCARCVARACDWVNFSARVSEDLRRLDAERFPSTPSASFRNQTGTPTASRPVCKVSLCGFGLGFDSLAVGWLVGWLCVVVVTVVAVFSLPPQCCEFLLRLRVGIFLKPESWVVSDTYNTTKK